MNPQSEPQSEIDDLLRHLGNVEPPAGLERRVSRRLQQQPPRVPGRRLQALAAFALAAGVALAAIMLIPALRTLVWHHRAGEATTAAPRVAAPATPGGFGAASAVHVPAGPVAVPPTPVNQGRGRSRSAVTVGPNGAVPPATPVAPQPSGGAASR